MFNQISNLISIPTEKNTMLNIGSIRIYILMTGWLEVVSNETN